MEDQNGKRGAILYKQATLYQTIILVYHIPVNRLPRFTFIVSCAENGKKSKKQKCHVNR